MVVSLGSNIAALNASGRLSRSSDRLSRIFEQLSSGMRINRASDDAAGLAVSTTLDARARVYTQGIRNANDAISALSIAEGTVSQLSAIGTRIKELSEQAANGSFSRTQRLTLDSEASALSSEWNRLVASTDFNGLKLIDGRFGRLNIQIGFGSDGLISSDLGTELDRTVGNGTFQAAVSISVVSNSQTFTGDFNRDNKVDILTAGGSGEYNFFHGNGDGTFKNPVSAAGPLAGNSKAQVADINGDGNLDIVAGSATGADLTIYLGVGDGTFRSGTTYVTGAAVGAPTIQFGDLNGDSKLDMAFSDGSTTLRIAIGNGDGTFGTAVSYAPAGGVSSFQLFDSNGDGRLDVVGLARTFLGNGDGTLQAVTANSIGSIGALQAGDFNHDGITDVVGNTGSGVVVQFGNGDGTFQGGATYALSTGTARMVGVSDLNGDGIQDIMVTTSAPSGFSFLLGNSDGTFAAQSTLYAATVSTSSVMVAADFNGDGAMDVTSILNTAGGKLYVFLSNTQQTTAIQRFDLTTQAGARQALSDIETALQRVYNELGLIGSSQSRLESALRTTQTAADNYNAASSRITDIDVASSTANLTREQILQQASSAVLAQANQQPSLVLQLLRAG